MTKPPQATASPITGPQLRAWREARGWDRGHLAGQLQQHANGVPVADYASLVRTIRRWEIGQNVISERYGLLLRQLGYPEVTADVSDVRWLARYGRRNRHLIWADIALTVIVTALSAALVIFGVQLHHAAASNANLCQSTNVSRAQQIQLWDYILGLSPPPKTAAERARVAAFRQHLRVIFAPRDCSDVNPGRP